MLQLINIEKRFGSQTIVDDVSLTVANGEFFSLLGPSGCGKTTLLRMIAGLEAADKGEVWIGGERVDALPPQQRPCNLVFQKYALFPHLNVAGNVAFGLRAKGVAPLECAKRVREALALVDMTEFATRFPETLSGGQQQRVALARALVNRPRVLLLDEPLAALDRKLREHMQTELRALQKRLALTFVFVTHDQEEAMVLSDRIGVMRNGRIEEVGTPNELYTNPHSAFVAGFVGRRSVILGSLGETAGEFRILDLPGGRRLRGLVRGNIASGGKAEALVRPETIRVATSGSNPPAGQNVLTGMLVHRLFRGLGTELHVEVADGCVLRALLPEGNAVGQMELGTEVALHFAPSDTLIFPGVRD